MFKITAQVAMLAKIQNGRLITIPKFKVRFKIAAQVAMV